MDGLKNTAETVNIALDPNLINLHLPQNVKQQSTVEMEGGTNNNNSTDGAQADQDATSTNDKLVLNPYEVYGQMPLPQLIPLILQQRNIPFSQLSEDNLCNKETLDQDTDALNQQILDTDDTISVPVDQPIMDNDGDIIMDTDSSTSNQNTATAATTTTTHNNNSNNNEYLNQKEFLQQEEEEKLTLTAYNTIRSELIENCNVALNESSLALETVSLLLSSTRQENATNYISPFLKRSVPMQSLNSDSIPLTQEPINEKMEQSKFTIGWKLICLDECKNKLRKMFKQLKFDLSMEHSYWNKITNNFSNLDVTFKIRDKSTGNKLLGLKYGYQDSGSTYKYDQGIAMIKDNIDSKHLELVPINNKSNIEMETFLRVKIYTKLESEDDYILSGESKVISLNNNNNSSSDNDMIDDSNTPNVRAQISKLKNVIFDKELIYQLKKECSQLISYGVYIENEKKIVIEMVSEKFEIELIYMDDDALSNQEQDQPKVHDKRANIFLIMLKMLLIVNFKQNLRSKLSVPNILNNNNNTNKKRDCIIIRPILSKLRHQNYKILLKRILNDTVMCNLPNFDLREENRIVHDAQADEDDEDDVKDYHLNKLDQEINMFKNILNPMQTKFIISKDDGQDPLQVSLQLRKYCQVEISIKYKQFESKFNEFKEVEEFLHFIVTNYME